MAVVEISCFLLTLCSSAEGTKLPVLLPLRLRLVPALLVSTSLVVLRSNVTVRLEYCTVSESHPHWRPGTASDWQALPVAHTLAQSKVM